MVKNFLSSVVVLCWRKHWIVIGTYAVLTLLAGLFAATHLDMDADESKLLSSDLDFRRA